MSELSVALASAFAGDRPLVFGAVRIALPSATIRLLDGASALTIGGEAYIGRDPNWGVLDTIQGLADTSTDAAPSVTIGFTPATALALSTMLDPTLQGSAVVVSIGAANMAAGTVIDTYPLFTGQWDVATVKWGANDRRVEVKCTSIAERLFAVEEGKRLSDAFHQSVWPGELGLGFVTGVEDTVPWGQQLDTSQLTVRTDQGGIYTSTGFNLAGNAGGAGGSFHGAQWQ